MCLSTDGLRAVALKTSDVPAPATVVVRDSDTRGRSNFFSLSCGSVASYWQRVLFAGSAWNYGTQDCMYLGPWNPLPILSVDGREQTRHRLRPKSHSHGASASAVRRSTGWRGPQPTAREFGELSKVSVIWLGVHPGTREVSSSCQWCSLCSSCASLQSFSRQTT